MQSVESSLTVQVSVSAPERHPVVVKFDSEPDELPLPDAVNRIAALVTSHPRVIVTTSVAGRYITDEFVDSAVLGQTAPQPVDVSEVLPQVATTSTPKLRESKEHQRPRIRANWVGQPALITAAIFAVIGVVGAGAFGAVTHYWQPQAAESVQHATPWASPKALNSSEPVDFTDPGWSVKVPPKATLISTELGIIVTGDRTFRVVNEQGWVSKTLKLAENPEFLSVVSIDGDRHIAVVDSGSLRIWSPNDANAFTTIDLPPTSSVTAAGGRVLIRTDTDVWTVKSGKLIPVAVPKSGQPVALTTQGLVTVTPPARITISAESDSEKSLQLTGLGAVTRWLGVNDSFAAVVWDSGDGYRLGIHGLSDGELEAAIPISADLAENGRWTHDASNVTATFGHLLIDFGSGTIAVKSDPAEPFAALVHGAAHGSIDGAGIWVTGDNRQLRLPKGHVLVSVYENSVITRSGKKVYEWKANQ